MALIEIQNNKRKQLDIEPQLKHRLSAMKPDMSHHIQNRNRIILSDIKEFSMEELTCYMVWGT